MSSVAMAGKQSCFLPFAFLKSILCRLTICLPKKTHSGRYSGMNLAHTARDTELDSSLPCSLCNHLPLWKIGRKHNCSFSVIWHTCFSEVMTQGTTNLSNEEWFYLMFLLKVFGAILALPLSNPPPISVTVWFPVAGVKCNKAMISWTSF